MDFESNGIQPTPYGILHTISAAWGPGLSQFARGKSFTQCLSGNPLWCVGRARKRLARRHKEAYPRRYGDLGQRSQALSQPVDAPSGVLGQALPNDDWITECVFVHVLISMEARLSRLSAVRCPTRRAGYRLPISKRTNRLLTMPIYTGPTVSEGDMS